MNDRTGEALFYALLLILPLSALLVRRPPLKRTALLVAAWVAIFVVGLLIAGQRDRFTTLLGSRSVEGRELRIPLAADGHFWADVTVNGVRRLMLIDSGATTTALSEATARSAGLDSDSPFPVIIDTANGRITAQTAAVDR